MSLTDDERRALASIERELRRRDPVLADRLDCAPTREMRQRRVTWAHRTVWAGLALMVVGLAAARGVVSLGAIVCAYGVLIVVVSLGVAVHNRTRSPGRTPGRRTRW